MHLDQLGASAIATIIRHNVMLWLTVAQEEGAHAWKEDLDKKTVPAVKVQTNMAPIFRQNLSETKSSEMPLSFKINLG